MAAAKAGGVGRSSTVVTEGKEGQPGAGVARIVLGLHPQVVDTGIGHSGRIKARRDLPVGGGTVGIGAPVDIVARDAGPGVTGPAPGKGRIAHHRLPGIVGGTMGLCRRGRPEGRFGIDLEGTIVGGGAGPITHIVPGADVKVHVVIISQRGTGRVAAGGIHDGVWKRGVRCAPGEGIAVYAAAGPIAGATPAHVHRVVI